MGRTTGRGYSSEPQVTPADDLEELKEQKDKLQEQMKRIEERIRKLEKKK
jgi:ubiquinone biosynthesis protein UbiJ